MNSRLSDYKVHVLTLLSVCVKLTHREMMGKRKLFERTEQEEHRGKDLPS